MLPETYESTVVSPEDIVAAFTCGQRSGGLAVLAATVEIKIGIERI
jgi:hypothetical protein